MLPAAIDSQRKFELLAFWVLLCCCCMMYAVVFLSVVVLLRCECSDGINSRNSVVAIRLLLLAKNWSSRRNDEMRRWNSGVWVSMGISMREYLPDRAGVKHL